MSWILSYTTSPSTTLFRSPQLKLYAEKEAKRYSIKPVTGPAAAARSAGLWHGGSIIKITDPEHTENLRKLDPDSKNYHHELGDRKSTRLNSSHANRSYAVF